ncbi:Rossmann-fold NAD(P)-binding domain-containing protein [Streptomyces mirabilis]|uniref:SDR family NAD(P)-dependent oxidoreductase n=1 Tax=Streptomyces mirabilis TaxID=68239 RepID=UPI0036B53AD4
MNASAHAAPKKSKQRLNGIVDKSLVIPTTPLDRLRLSGKRLLVVGGTNGLGQAVAQQALAQGAEVTVVGRTFRDRPTNGLIFVQADLSSMREAVRLGEELPAETYDVAYFSLGIMAAKTREVTREGVERDIAISYLSRLAVLQGLSSRVGTGRPDGAPQARVFIMGAPGTGTVGTPDDMNSENGYKAMVAHMNTVAGNEMLVLAGADLLPGPAYFGLNPGFISTGIRSNFLGEGSVTHRMAEFFTGMAGPSPETYGERMVPLVFADGLNGRTGLMFDNKARVIRATDGLDKEYVSRYMSASQALLQRALG